MPATPSAIASIEHIKSMSKKRSSSQFSRIAERERQPNQIGIVQLKISNEQLIKNSNDYLKIFSDEGNNPFKIHNPMTIPSLITFKFDDQEVDRSKGKGKILVVDDEKFNCDIIFGFLMILGVKDRKENTKFAYNGEQAVNEIRRAFDEDDPFRYKLILMDCNMPFLDGYEATKIIR
jgi:PleD family two-component response regulator